MKKQIVADLVDEYNSERMVLMRFLDHQKRLALLSNKYGVEQTAFAAGLSASTLLVYARAKTPVAISEKCVAQAEWVFDNYKE